MENKSTSSCRVRTVLTVGVMISVKARSRVSLQYKYFVTILCLCSKNVLKKSCRNGTALGMAQVGMGAMSAGMGQEWEKRHGNGNRHVGTNH